MSLVDGRTNTLQSKWLKFDNSRNIRFEWKFFADSFESQDLFPLGFLICCFKNKNYVGQKVEWFLPFHFQMFIFFINSFAEGFCLRKILFT